MKNALEAIGSDVINELKREKKPAVMITASALEDKPRITVSDCGPGIPADMREEIFQQFYTSKPGGSGIGLALNRQIMNLHKGSLTCSSTRLRASEVCNETGGASNVSNETGGVVFILQL